MSIKKNFLYNGILLISQYIIPLIIFPYISRVFGVEKIGVVNWVDSTVNYFILISMLGLTLLGVRETAKKRNDKDSLSSAFISLLILHTVFTICTLIIYTITVYYVPKFNQHKELFFIGASKIIFNVLLVEWFYRGIENFRFITIRSIIVKVIYVGLIFLLVKKESDYRLYFVLTCLVVVFNAVINIYYARNFIYIKLSEIKVTPLLKPYVTLGTYILLTSMYTNFNITYLGIVSTEEAVGAYTTALKLYTIILGLFTALNTVLIPRASSLINDKEHSAFDEILQKSLNFVITFSLPIIVCGICLTRSIIFLLAGGGFEKSIQCFRVILPLILFVGIAQIFSYLILIPFKQERKLAYTSVIGAFVGILLNFSLVPIIHEIGSALVVLVSELLVTVILYYHSSQIYKLKISIRETLSHLLTSLFYIPICLICNVNFDNPFIIILLASIGSCLYFILSQIFIIKNRLVIDMSKRVIRVIKLRMRFQQ